MADADGWITWAQAAEIVGCPASTIDWYSRQGRIERRPFHGSRPSLRRESVEEFAAWWADQQRERAARHVDPALRRSRRQQLESGSAGAPEPPPAGWLSTSEAAAVVGMSLGHMTWLVAHDQLIGCKAANQIWIEPESAQRLATERSRWISTTTAANLAGRSTATISEAAQQGAIRQRKLGRAYGSLDRNSVLEWAEQRNARLEGKASRRAQRAHGRELAGRPDLAHEWLSQDDVAKLFGVSRVRVGQLAIADRLPFTVAGRRRWFRRDHMTLVLAARRFMADQLVDYQTDGRPR